MFRSHFIPHSDIQRQSSALISLGWAIVALLGSLTLTIMFNADSN